ncbi:MAG TPA: ABC transporter permease [Sediminispirochaeta sp.]|nr:ABC transporter permease [Sediminispirochaeta sp.]
MTGRKSSYLKLLVFVPYLAYLIFPQVQRTLLGTLFPATEELVYPRAGLLYLFGEHLLLVLLSEVLAFLSGLSLGIVVTRRWGEEFKQPVLDLSALLQTFPPVAVLTLAVPALGFGFAPAFLALYLYSILPIVRNCITGLSSVSPSLKEAARGMGMNSRQILFQVELPQAFPAILAGTRISTIINIGTATVGGVIGAGGLGVVIVAGLVRDNTAFVLQGALAAAGLALAADGIFELWNSRLSVVSSRSTDNNRN